MRAVAAVRHGARVRTQWLALSAALVVLTGVVVSWAVGAAGSRVMVVQVARPVAAGAALQAADLMTAAVAFDAGVESLVPAGSLDALLGRLAAIDLEPGVLLQRGMWREGESLADDEVAVGAVLAAGRFPPGLAIGDVVIGASLDTSLLESTPSSTTIPGGVDERRDLEMRVIDVALLDNGTLSVCLAVPARRAIEVARLAATEQLVVVRQRSGQRAAEGSDP